jgi:transketolase
VPVELGADVSASVDTTLEQRAINVIRGLAMDGPQAAASGHPGTAMALAPLAHVLWTETRRYDATDPGWADRDRFVLSAGHASILLYSMLYLTGFGLALDDLRDFRQWGSATPGHPEAGHTAGVEVTTGPLGQGFANAVGLGLAERWLRARFGPGLCDHHTFVICGDGDLAEGISHEAASLAGHLGLGRLIYVYDDNHISIDGPTELALSDDAPGRFASYGWHVDDVGEVAEDTTALAAALDRARAVEDAPSLIVLRSHIGYPSPEFTDTAAAHGMPFGEEEIARTKSILGLPDEPFHVPDDVLDLYRQAGIRGRAEREAWDKRLAGWDGDRAAWDACQAGRGLPDWSVALPDWETGDSVATRKASAACLDAAAPTVPGLVAGGADLTGNTGTQLAEGVTMLEQDDGRQIHFGVREHAMGGIMNGMALHGGLLPVGGTFLVFSDYMRGAVRLAALSQAHVIYSWSHDSVGVGEDGPTHQPVEHLSSLRAMPGLRVIRPGDANEVAQAWEVAVDRTGPTALILSRQSMPVLEGTSAPGHVERGGYVLVDPSEPADVVLVGTGSELALCVDAAADLGRSDIAARVVSLPSWELFDEQDEGYRSTVLPPTVPKVSIEAGTTFGWDRYVDRAIGIDRFGASAPGALALAELGMTADRVASVARDLLA